MTGIIENYGLIYMNEMWILADGIQLEFKLHFE